MISEREESEEKSAMHFIRRVSDSVRKATLTTLILVQGQRLRGEGEILCPYFIDNERISWRKINVECKKPKETLLRILSGTLMILSAN